MLRTIVVALFIAIYLLVVGLPLVLWTMLTRDDRALYKWAVRGAGFALKLGGVRIRLEGSERLRPGGTYVFMSNHVGMIEPVALVVSLPRVSALAKLEIFSIPVLGRAMRIAGFVPVLRGTAHAPAAVEQAVQTLRGGRSILCFPEGTRSRTGELLPFRRGVFLMAIRGGVPVVPITCLGSREIMLKGDLRIHPGEVRIVIHEPIATAGMGEEERFALTERVRDVIGSALGGRKPVMSDEL